MKKKVQVEIVEPYDLMQKTSKKRIIMYSPRISGKTHAFVQDLYLSCRRYPGRDIMICRANYNAMEDSLYEEILAMGEELGIEGFFKPFKAPLRMTTILGNRIYFKGIGGADMSRIRGKKSKNKYCRIYVDETQQLRDELSLKHAIATLIRDLDPAIDSKIIIAGNPEQPKGHWWNTYCKKMRGVDKYEFIDATYQDIIKYLNQDTLDEIEIERELYPANYKFMYLGSLDDLEGGAYGQFKQERHYITEEQANTMFAGERIVYVIFGGDGAITNDATCLVPLLIFESGRALAVERFFYDPKLSGQVLSNSQLVPLIQEYLVWLEYKYKFRQQGTEKYFAVDCAAADLIAQLRYELTDDFIVKEFTKKAIIRNNNVVNNAFAKNVVYILNTGGQYLWHNGKTMQVDPLVDQLESVIWKNYNFDPTIDNDATDALTYGVNYYFLNPDNLSFPERQSAYKTA